MVFKTTGRNEITMGVNVVEKVTTDCITASLQDSRRGATSRENFKGATREVEGK